MVSGRVCALVRERARLCVAAAGGGGGAVAAAAMPARLGDQPCFT